MARDPNELSATNALLVCVGIIPAFLLTMLSVVGAAVLGNWMRLLVVASAIGTAGLLWGLIGAPARSKWLLLSMLVIGELAMLLLLVPLLTAAANPENWTWEYLAACSFTLGPMSAGAVFIAEQIKRTSRHEQDCR